MPGPDNNQVFLGGFRAFLLQRSLGCTLAWTAILVGVCLPWCIASGVKFYLDYQGSPTWDWRYFVHPAMVLYELWATLWFALPGLGIAVLSYLFFSGRFRFPRRLNKTEKATIILASLIVGAAGSVSHFIDIFMEFHPVVLMLPFFVTVRYVGHYALGFGIGLILATSGYLIRKERRHGHTC